MRGGGGGYFPMGVSRFPASFQTACVHHACFPVFVFAIVFLYSLAASLTDHEKSICSCSFYSSSIFSTPLPWNSLAALPLALAPRFP